MLIYDYETLAILNANESAMRLSGYSHSEITCLSLHDLLPAEDVPKLLELIAEVPHFDRSGPWRHRAKDGTVVQLLITSHAMTSGPYAARLLMAENPDDLAHDPEESLGIRWLPWDEAISSADEPALRRMLEKARQASRRS